MLIISHRGFWKTPDEKNTEAAFRRSFELGFGTETDIRDYKGELVISHDIADEGCMLFEEFLRVYKEVGDDLLLALNIKADGLQKELGSLLDKYEVSRYFVFDMSVPDGLLYLQDGMKVFTRQSEYEPNPSFYKNAGGVWIDQLDGNWITEDVIKRHIDKEKKVCIVSPELHKREYQAEWDVYRNIDNVLKSENIIICTDYPEKAKEVFNV